MTLTEFISTITTTIDLTSVVPSGQRPISCSLTATYDGFRPSGDYFYGIVALYIETTSGYHVLCNANRAFNCTDAVFDFRLNLGPDLGGDNSEPMLGIYQNSDDVGLPSGEFADLGDFVSAGFWMGNVATEEGGAELEPATDMPFTIVSLTFDFVSFRIPAPILTATARHYNNIQLSVTVPAPIITAYTGAGAVLKSPAPALAATGTVQVVARVELEVPVPELTAVASTIVGASVEIELPAPVLYAATGAYASIEVLAPILTATGVTENLIWVEFTIPSPELTAEVTVGGMATVTLSVPAPILAASGIVGAIAQVVLVLPAVILTSNVKVSPGVGLPATSVVTETTYAINLTTGAVTTLLLGEVTKLITAHGRLYGLRSGTLVRLDGNLDGATTIPATVRFAPQTFNNNRAKRLSTVYLNTREDDGLTLEVISDEKTAWRYQTPTDNAPAYGTHKIKIGRGIKFHTAGFMLYNRNGGRMDVGGMELIVDVLSRRPKT